MGSRVDIEALVAAADAGSVRALGRLVTRVEAGGPGAAEVGRALVGRPRAARVVGLTGSPGVGKSTLTTRLIGHHRARAERVAVLAVDPSSPFSGGALLGDRVRMSEHAGDPGVFIRSMSSRGALGGLAAATPAAIDVLAALGFDVVLVETVGVGQNEVAVMQLADTVLVVLAPGMGDGVQAAKAGILEIADLLVVNKADRDGAGETVRELKAMVALGRSGTAGPDQWRVPVVQTVASTGAGLAELAAEIGAHGAFLDAHGGAQRRRRSRAALAVRAVVLDRLDAALSSAAVRDRLDGAAREVAEGRLDHHAAARSVLEALPSGLAWD